MVFVYPFPTRELILPDVFALDPGKHAVAVLPAMPKARRPKRTSRKPRAARKRPPA
jgi:hypothetical protein